MRAQQPEFNKLSFVEQVVLGKKDGFFIYDFTALAADGTPMWYIMAVSQSMSEAFLKAINTLNENVNLVDYGELLASGAGNSIPLDVKQQVLDQYGWQLP